MEKMLETLSGVHTVTACALISHIGEIDCFKNADKLASYAGKRKNVQNKNQGNRELYAVLYLLAMQQVQVNTKGEARNPMMRAYFECKVAEVRRRYKPYYAS